MLNSFEKGSPRSRPLGRPLEPAAADRLSHAEGGGNPHLRANNRARVSVFARRWLPVLAACAVVALSAYYNFPWYVLGIALIAFALIPALIARTSLVPLMQPAVFAPYQKSEPETYARAFTGALPEPAIVLASDGTIIAFNGKAGDLFGGLKPGAHISSAMRNPQVLNAVMTSGPGHAMQTVTFTERVPVERHMAATVSYLGPHPSILLFLRDLTEQRRVDQLRADFIANASHEIKTPLASLVGFIETLQGPARNDADARDRFLAIMAKQAERMARLIDNLMSLSRVEMRAHLKPQDPVLIDELVAQACDALEPMAAEANIQVEIQSQISDVPVLGDKDELTQVFINLVHNAIKYGGSGGRVKVSIARLDTGGAPLISITIEDDGPGIARQHLPRLTERFYRVPDSSALEKGGTGLGLAIVKHVVNRHRGELRISSEEGSGAKFTVLLAEHSPSLAGGLPSAESRRISSG